MRQEQSDLHERFGVRWRPSRLERGTIVGGGLAIYRPERVKGESSTELLFRECLGGGEVRSTAMSNSTEELSSERAIEEFAAEEPSSSENDVQEKREAMGLSVWREVRQVRSRSGLCGGSSESESSEWWVDLIGGLCMLIPRPESLKAVEVVAPW